MEGNEVIITAVILIGREGSRKKRREKRRKEGGRQGEEEGRERKETIKVSTVGLYLS